MAAKLFLPLFLPVDYTTHLRRLKQEHSAELSALLQPLERLSHREREAVGASGIAQAAALAWEANADVLAALLPRAVQRTLALPAPGVADWILPQPVDSGAGTYDTVQDMNVQSMCMHNNMYMPCLFLAGRRAWERGRPLVSSRPRAVGDSGRQSLFCCGRRSSCWPISHATGVPTALRCTD